MREPTTGARAVGARSPAPQRTSSFSRTRDAVHARALAELTARRAELADRRAAMRASPEEADPIDLVDAILAAAHAELLADAIAAHRRDGDGPATSSGR